MSLAQIQILEANGLRSRPEVASMLTTKGPANPKSNLITNLFPLPPIQRQASTTSCRRARQGCSRAVRSRRSSQARSNLAATLRVLVHPWVTPVTWRVRSTSWWSKGRAYAAPGPQASNGSSKTVDFRTKSWKLLLQHFHFQSQLHYFRLSAHPRSEIAFEGPNSGQPWDASAPNSWCTTSRSQRLQWQRKGTVQQPGPAGNSRGQSSPWQDKLRTNPHGAQLPIGNAELKLKYQPLSLLKWHRGP